MERFRAEREALARLQGKRKLDRILDAEDPGALVRSLPAEDLYFTIQEIGTSDARPLVQLASPEQFRTFVDLDAWERHTLHPVKVLVWLDLALDDDEEAFREKLGNLDIEVVSLLLRGIVRIIDIEEEGEPEEDPVGAAVERTPEGRFILVYPNEQTYGATRKLIYELYAQDPFRAARLLYAVRWELESELHETAYRWRNARLADLGFPSPEEAASLYAQVDLKSLPPPAEVALPAEPPGYFLASFERGNFFDETLSRLPDEAKETLRSELVTLLNAAMVADDVAPNDLEEVEKTATAVRDTLALGMLHLTGGDAAQAAELCVQQPLRRIFQVGFTRTLQVRWRADSLAKSLPLRLEPEGSWLPDFPFGELLGALRQRRPRFFGSIAGAAAAPQARPFATLDDLALADRALDAIEELGRAFRDAGLDPVAAGRMVTDAWGEAGLATVRYSELFLTALARRTIGLSFAFEALPTDRLEEAARASFDEEGKLLPDVRKQAEAALGDSPALRDFVAGALDRLEAELGQQVLASGFELDRRLAVPWIVAP